MKKTDVLIIGSGPVGAIAALTGKSNNPDKDFLLIRREKRKIVPCKLPYLFESLDCNWNGKIPYDEVLNNSGLKIKIDEVILIDQKNKICVTSNGSKIKFEKLVLALGSIPIIPKWAKIHKMKNIFTVPKNRIQLNKIFTELKNLQNIVIIGGNFIGVEFANELNKVGLNVTIVEKSPHIFCPTCDEEMITAAERALKSIGIEIKIGLDVKKIIGDKKVTGVLLENDELINTDAVIIALGYRPNTNLAKKAKLKVNVFGSIKVDKYMRTSNPDIFAVGDCAEKIDSITKKITNKMLSPIACTEGQIAGKNLYKLRSEIPSNGNIFNYYTTIENIGFGIAGLNEKTASELGFNTISETYNEVIESTSIYSKFHKQFIKLIVDRNSGILLGGEIVNGRNTEQIINLIRLAIQNKLTINSVLTNIFGPHPLQTAPPNVQPIIKTAKIISEKLNQS